MSFTDYAWDQFLVEAMMPEQSSVHAYLNWTKQRIDEMDATLASLEAKGGQVKAELKAKADQMLAEMKKKRDEFPSQGHGAGSGGRSGHASRQSSTGIAVARL